MTFRVGQKVTMIAPWTTGPSYYGEIFTEFGEVYTIREILLVPRLTTSHQGWPALRFCEIVNAPNFYHGRDIMEQPFPASNFRPVVTTDISALQALLVPGAKIREEA